MTWITSSLRNVGNMLLMVALVTICGAFSLAGNAIQSIATGCTLLAHHTGQFLPWGHKLRVAAAAQVEHIDERARVLVLIESRNPIAEPALQQLADRAIGTLLNGVKELREPDTDLRTSHYDDHTNSEFDIDQPRPVAVHHS